MKPLTPTTPHVIIMVGIPGAGKSTFTEHFSKTFNAPVVDYDKAFNIVGSVQAASQVTDLLLDQLLKTRHTLIYEGPTSNKAGRAAVIKKITTAGYQPLLVWVQTESAEALRRSTKKQSGKAAMTAAEFDTAIRSFGAPTPEERPVVISGKHTYATQLKVVLKHLAGPPRPESPEQPRVRSGRNIIVR